MPKLSSAGGADHGAGPVRRLWRAIGLALPGAGLVLGLAACDTQRIAELEEGVSTEADVRQRFGEPAAVYQDVDGGRTLEFPRQPEGQVNYMISVGPDGRMSALRQVLRPDQFARVQSGLDKASVRRLLGRPAQTRPYPLRQEEAWEWRFHADHENRLFVVTFDANGQVRRTETLIDPRGTEAGGGR